MNNHRVNCKCILCSGPDVVKMTKATIEKMGMAVISVCNTITYTVGMCGGEKGGYEFICTGIGNGAATSVFTQIREHLPFIKSMIKQAESQNDRIIVFRNILNCVKTNGDAFKGSITIIKITEENRKQHCTMHGKCYKHRDFTVWQCLICDSEGREAFSDGYDQNMIDVQKPLFETEN